MFIKIDTDNLSDLERTLLRAVLGEDTPGTVIHMADAKAAQEAQETPAPSASRSRTRKAAAKATAPDPEPQADATDSDEDIREMERQSDEDEEDLLGDDGPTLDDAVDRATALVQDGKGPKVKAALTKVGADKVRNLEGEQIQQFLDALKKA